MSESVTSSEMTHNGGTDISISQKNLIAPSLEASGRDPKCQQPSVLDKDEETRVDAQTGTRGVLEVPSSDEQDSLPLPSLMIEDVLKWHSIPTPIIESLAGSDLTTGIDRVLNFGDLPLNDGRPIAFCGASGSGKTLSLSKLIANNICTTSTNALVLACDRTPGSYAKISSSLYGTYAEIVDACFPGAVIEPYLDNPAGRQILIDLPGVCIYAKKQMSEVMDIVDRTKAHLVLVIPAGMDPEEAADISAAFIEKGATHMIASRLEQSGRIGSVITAAACGLSLTYGSYSSSLNKGFSLLSPGILARRLLTLP